MSAPQETSPEIKVKLILDEANLAFCETAERSDAAGNRQLDGSPWEQGKMEGEYDQEDFQRILELQLETAQVCDTHPQLEEKTAEMFQKVTPDNGAEILQEVLAESGIRDLARTSITIFMLRFPTVQSFINKGHPLVLATDEYMLENANAQNWHDYRNIADEMGWLQS
ncbi:MAG: hypothetical protein ACE5ER_08805 [Nitrospinaceae bacterium]